MQEGAVGMSSALIYAPGVYADTAELIALAEVVGRYGGCILHTFAAKATACSKRWTR